MLTYTSAQRWKHEITNQKSETNFNIQISKVFTLEIYKLEFVWNLDFGISNFQCYALASLLIVRNWMQFRRDAKITKHTMQDILYLFTQQ